MTTAATYSVSCTASTRPFVRTWLLLALAGLVAHPGLAGDITGVLLSDHSGPSGRASGTVELAVGGSVQTLYYGEPLPRNFRSVVCRDIGAVWTVSVQAMQDSTLNIERATCDGRVDEDIHSSWLLVRDYLDLTMKSAPGALDLVSAHWRSSPEYRRYAAETKNLDLSGYASFGKGGRCVDVGEHGKDRVELTAGPDCSIVLSGKTVSLVFTIIRFDNRRWEIGRIRLQ